MRVNGVSDILHGDPERRHAHVVQPDTHGIGEVAQLGNVADAGDARDLVLDRNGQEVGQVIVAVRIGGRIECNDRQHVAGGFLGGEPLALHFLRKRGLSPVHPVLRIDGVFVAVRPDVETDFDGGPAVIRGGRGHVEHVLDAVELGFDRLDHGIHHRLGIRSGIIGGDVDLTRRDIRIECDRKRIDTDGSAKQDEDRNDDRKPGPVDEEFTDHGCPRLLFRFRCFLLPGRGFGFPGCASLLRGG